MGERYHLVFAEQTAFGTYDAGTIALPADEITINPGQEIIERRLTGRTRALADKVLGAKMVDGSFRMPLWNEHMPLLLRAAMFHGLTTTQQGATAAYQHGLVPDDDAAIPYMSVETQLTSSIAQFVRSAVIDQLTIAFANKAIAEISGTFFGEDETKDNSTWSDGSTASPSITATPTYPSVTPFTSFDVTVAFGGSVALTDGALIVTGGTADTSVEGVTVEVSNSLEHVHTFNGERTPSAFHAGAREVSITIEDDWTTPNESLYDALKAGTEQALRITATGAVAASPHLYTFEIVLPLAYVKSAPWSPLTGAIDKRTQSIELGALYDPTTGADIGFRIIDTQTSY